MKLSNLKSFEPERRGRFIMIVGALAVLALFCAASGLGTRHKNGNEARQQSGDIEALRMEGAIDREQMLAQRRQRGPGSPPSGPRHQQK